MTEYNDYANARTVVDNLISNIDSDIEQLEKKKTNLKQTRKHLDEEFYKRSKELPNHIG